MNNFFQKSAFGGNGMVSGFRDMPGHISSFNNNFGNHATFQNRHDFSLETRVNLNGFNNMGGLEQRINTFNTLHP